VILIDATVIDLCLSICLFVYLSTYLSIYLSIYLASFDLLLLEKLALYMLACASHQA